jgi:hypothetical protein
LSQFANLIPIPVTPDSRENPDYSSFVKYKGKTFLVDGFNLLFFENGKIQKLNSYDGSRNWAEDLQVYENDLWVFGHRGAARFDGNEWDYFFPPSFS